jgi:hypothetical protein
VKRTNLLLAFAILAILFCAIGPRPAAAATAGTNPLSDQLAEAAKAAGVPINTEETVTLTSPDVNLAASSIQGFEQVPATDFAKGVDFGYIYLDAPRSGLPAGNYKLRAHAAAGDIQVGEYGGTVDLIGADGKVASTLDATIDTSSLTVPNPLPYARTKVGVSLNHQDPAQGIIVIHFWYLCPNGSWVHVIIIIW